MKTKVRADTRQFINQAWLRDGNIIVGGEALILACLLHSQGAGRDSQDMTDLQRIMGDINLKDEK